MNREILERLDELSLHHPDEQVRKAAEIVYPAVRSEVQQR